MRTSKSQHSFKWLPVLHDLASVPLKRRGVHMRLVATQVILWGFETTSEATSEGGHELGIMSYV
uniref:Uncharacterized protein n=1 Tax=Arundo donax TaxID=35708 RepID=A0A0A9BMU2_ARUDO